MTVALALAFGDNPPPIDPADAMLFAVSSKYAEVVWLRGKVADLDEADMVWNTTRVKDEGDDRGTTQEAKPSTWWAMLRSAEDQLVKFAAAARAAGCDEARVRIAEGQGALVADVLKAVLDGILAALTAELGRMGLHEDVVVSVVQEAWKGWVADIVPAELRRLGGAA